MTAITSESAADWTDQYQRYLATSAQNAASVRELYGEVIDRAVHGEILQQSIEERSPLFFQAYGTAYANELAEVSVRFLTGIVASGTTYTHEIADQLAPDAVVRPDIRPPVPESADWVTWLQRFAQFSDQHNRARADMLRTLMDKVAAGEVTPPAASTVPVPPDQVPQSGREMLRLYFELLAGLDDVNTRYAVRYLSTLLGETRGEDFALRLRGRLGSTGVVRFAVHNTQPIETSVRCVISDLRRQDGIDPAFVPSAELRPERFQLAPGEERVVTLAILLDADRFSVGPRYVGTLQVLSPEGTLLATAVHVEPFGADGASSAGTAAGDAPGGHPDADGHP